VLGAESYAGFEKQVDAAYTLRKDAAHGLMNALGTDSEKTAVLAFQEADRQVRETRSSMNEAVIKKEKSADLNDTNYVFFYFVKEFLPIGMLGLIISVIFSASMSSTSSELNALSSSTSMDIYRRLIRKDASPGHYLLFSRLSTLAWGIYAIIFACFANRLGSLIEAVNVVGSLVYGTILGIFLAGFLLKRVQSRAVMVSALLWQTVILGLYLFTPVPFLWYNVIAGVGVPVLALLVQLVLEPQRR
jgi:Na+/proline symporter